ncbi:DUF6090 family protein [Geojedonia litorea]|uniref:DUF6090 family protein n=1 Tax=Geojedonia litorea TaxID=1268269 RepID=A0ABV9N8V0_9FLAO
MIKFFRKIRYNLMETGKTAKYFKYAIGEIALVMIGILLALQVNNWNENRKNNIEERDYYCKFLDDVRQDHEMLNKQKEIAKLRLHHSNKLLQNLQKDNVDLADLVNDMKLSVQSINAKLEPTKIAFEDLKSSGSLKIIKDNNIKIKLGNYYANAQGIMNVINDNYAAIGERFKSNNERLNTGWVYLIEDQKGFDTSLVDVSKLKALSKLDETIKISMVNDALAYLGTNSRNLYHYDTLETEINNLEAALILKCTTND